MSDLIAVLRSGFDYVIIDSPPLLPVVDALALAAFADKILVVIEWCRTPRASLDDAFRVLRPEATRIAGVVLNKVDFNELPGYSGYQYRQVLQQRMKLGLCRSFPHAVASARSPAALPAPLCRDHR